MEAKNQKKQKQKARKDSAKLKKDKALVPPPQPSLNPNAATFVPSFTSAPPVLPAATLNVSAKEFIPKSKLTNAPSYNPLYPDPLGIYSAHSIHNPSLLQPSPFVIDPMNGYKNPYISTNLAQT